MKPNNIYRICVDEDTKEVIILGVDNTETRYQFPTIDNAYDYVENIKAKCEKNKINMEVYNDIDEAKSNGRLHDVRNRSN